MIQDDNKKAELFNDYFCKQADLNDSETSVPDITDILINGLEQITITENEVEDILKILDTSKAIGPDLLNPRLLKEAASMLKYPLCRLFNLSLTLSTFPSEWKYANVTPVFKKDCPSNLKNYRPISLISILAKVMERLVYKHIYNYLIDNNLITSHQSGFTPGDSAVNQLLYITNEFGRALDEGKEVRVVFCDISKAFDRVWHKGLLRKLESIGIRGSLLSWVKNYLSERKQRVVINNSTSSWRDINAGVPQGSILGPLLFIVFINDILTDINSTIKLFADDTSLYLIVDDPQETAQTLNDDLVKLHAWSTKWLVNFNPQKTETMTISRKLNKPHQPNLIMNNTIISTVTEHKHLGLQLSDDGNWNKHIDMITKKAFSRVNILRKFKFILDRKTLETIYITFIRPLLEYADVVWDTKTQILINKLENVQVEAARIVTGGTRLVSLSNLYIETGWEKLKDRRERHRTIQFYKMSNNLTPQYLSNLIPQNFGMIHDHNTRHTSRIPPVRTRTSLYASYFIPSSVQLWNQQPENIKSSRSVQIIKSNLQPQNNTKPIYYYIGTRLGQILHARLRMQCSSLNHHLFRKNIVNSPFCQCGATETTAHFLLHCPRHNATRLRYIHTINLPINLNTDLLLFGSTDLTNTLNTDIFLNVQKFIISSKRFTS